MFSLSFLLQVQEPCLKTLCQLIFTESKSWPYQPYQYRYQDYHTASLMKAISAIARFSRTLSTMFAAGVPLVEAMSTVAGATGNILFHEVILNIREDVAAGTQLHESMRSHELFPYMVVQMISIGEQSGSLDTMLAKIADFYEDDDDNLVNGLSSLLEPLIMSVLGYWSAA